MYRLCMVVLLFFLCVFFVDFLHVNKSSSQKKKECTTGYYSNYCILVSNADNVA